MMVVELSSTACVWYPSTFMMYIRCTISKDTCKLRLQGCVYVINDIYIFIIAVAIIDIIISVMSIINIIMIDRSADHTCVGAHSAVTEWCQLSNIRYVSTLYVHTHRSDIHKSIYTNAQTWTFIYAYIHTYINIYTYIVY